MFNGYHQAAICQDCKAASISCLGKLRPMEHQIGCFDFAVSPRGVKVERHQHLFAHVDHPLVASGDVQNANVQLIRLELKSELLN